MEKSELILSLAGKDERAAFKLLFDTYYETMVLFADRILYDLGAAEDVVQDCFVNLWLSRRFTTLKNNLDRYLYTVVKSKSLDYIARDQRKQKAYTGINEASIERAETPEIVQIDEYEALYRAIDCLPEERRKVFMMICVDGMKYHEAAESLGLSINTIKTQMTRSIQFLRETLKKHQFPSLLFYLLKKHLL